MEPTEAELNTISTLEEAFNWAGVSAEVRASLSRELGNPGFIRDIVFVPRPTWDTVVGRTRTTAAPPGGAAGPPQPVELTPIDLARLEIFRRVCFRRIGATPDSPGMIGAAPAAVAPAPAPLAGSPSPRKLKLSAIVDQTLDAEVQALDQTEVSNMYQAYQAKYGASPSPESEPTADQLAAVRQLVSSGASPYIDMAVYGPQGLRRLRKLTFASFSLNSMGEWARKEMPGPPDWESWSEVFRCIRTTFLLLETITPERLDGYSEFIRQLHARFGPTCWDIIYLGDVHMRSEQFERIRRKLDQNPEHGYTGANPWNAVYAQAILEDSFWSREVITPATLRLARGSGGTVGQGPESSLGRKLTEQEGEDGDPRKGPRKKRQKVREADDRSKHNGTSWTHNRRGAEICDKWNQGKCGNTKPQSKCTSGRSHQCSSCLGPHMAKDCKSKK